MVIIFIRLYLKMASTYGPVAPCKELINSLKLVSTRKVLIWPDCDVDDGDGDDDDDCNDDGADDDDCNDDDDHDDERKVSSYQSPQLSSSTPHSLSLGPQPQVKGFDIKLILNWIWGMMRMIISESLWWWWCWCAWPSIIGCKLVIMMIMITPRW